MGTIKGFIQFGLNTYDMYEVTEAKMDKLMRDKGDSWEWPYRCCLKTRRVWPKLKPGMSVFFQ